MLFYRLKEMSLTKSALFRGFYCSAILLFYNLAEESDYTIDPSSKTIILEEGEETPEDQKKWGENLPPGFVPPPPDEPRRPVRVPRNPIPRTTIPRNPLPKNKIPRNIPPRNPIPRERVPRNVVPSNKIPQNPIPRNKIPRTRIPRTRIPND
jgi:hypothetical protein